MIDGLVHYQVLARWARGGMADVFVARQTGKMGFDKLVALKVLRGDLLHDQELRRMFIQEARTAVLLNHPRIIQTYDAEEAGENLYLVMEFVRGETLRHVVQAVQAAGGGASPAFALELVHQIGLALDYAHHLTDLHDRDLHLVHRDVAPSNIMLTDQGGTKLLDFGIAKVTAAGHSTDAGVVKGKFAYMSPEQVRGAELDARSDVYSLGLVLWELLTCRRALLGERDVDVIRAALKSEVPAPSQAGGPAIDALDRLVLRALAPRPEDRFASAREFAEASARLRVQLYPDFNMSGCVRELLGTHFPERRARLDELLSRLEDSSDIDALSPLDLETHPSARMPRVGAPPSEPPSGPAAVDLLEAAALPSESLPAPPTRWHAWGVGLALLAVAIVAALLFFFRSQAPLDRVVVVATEPPGAHVLAEGAELGSTPLDVTVHQGAPLALTFSLRGYERVSRIIRASDTDGVRVELTRTEAEGSILVRTTPAGAEVSVDGAPRPGRTPLVVDGLWSGQPHRITLRHAGYEPEVREFDLPDAGRADLAVELEPLVAAPEVQDGPHAVVALHIASSEPRASSMRPDDADAPPPEPSGAQTPTPAVPSRQAAVVALEPLPAPPPLPTRPPPLPLPRATPQTAPSTARTAPPAPPSLPTLRVGMPRVTGVIDRSSLRRRLQALEPQLRACLLNGGEVRHGSSRLRFVIDEAGRARDITLSGVAFAASPCVQRATHVAAFPGSTASDAIVLVDLDVRRP